MYVLNIKELKEKNPYISMEEINTLIDNKSKELKKEDRKIYMREYYEKNKEKIKKYNQEYYKKNKKNKEKKI